MTTDSVFELVYQSLFTMAIYIDLFIIPSYPADRKHCIHTRAPFEETDLPHILWIALTS